MLSVECLWSKSESIFEPISVEGTVQVFMMLTGRGGGMGLGETANEERLVNGKKRRRVTGDRRVGRLERG